MTDTLIKTIIAERSAKLEKVKPFISLKSYDLLAKKLLIEQAAALGEHGRIERATEKRERAQILSKTFFTEHRLPHKAIRID